MNITNPRFKNYSRFLVIKIKSLRTTRRKISKGSYRLKKSRIIFRRSSRITLTLPLITSMRSKRVILCSNSFSKPEVATLRSKSRHKPSLRSSNNKSFNFKGLKKAWSKRKKTARLTWSWSLLITRKLCRITKKRYNLWKVISRKRFKSSETIIIILEANCKTWFIRMSNYSKLWEDHQSKFKDT